MEHEIGEKIKVKTKYANGSYVGGEIRGAEGTIVSKHKTHYGVSLVSDNGTRGKWAVMKDQIEGEARQKSRRASPFNIKINSRMFG